MADMCSSGEPLDPTPLGVVQLEYANKVEFLLSADAVSGLTSEELTTFRSTNCPYAFVCRFPGCSGMLAGFPTHDLRAQHEMTHKPTLFCTHSRCTYKLPFASRQSLGRHIRTFHNSVPRSAPKSIRRQRATRSKDRHDHVETPNAPGDLEVHTQAQSTVAAPWEPFNLDFKIKRGPLLPNYKPVESTQSFNATGPTTFEPLFELDSEDDFIGRANFSTDNNHFLDKYFLGNEGQLPVVTRQGHADGMSPPEVNTDFAAQSSLLSSYRSANENVQRALQAAQYARGQTPENTVVRSGSPFRKSSPYRQPSNSFNSPMNSAVAAREQNREAEAAYAIKSQMQPSDDSDPKTIVPTDIRWDQADVMSPPEINIDFAPPSRQEHSQPRDDPSTINVVSGSNYTKYCICQRVDFGDMIACDNDNCPYQWFYWDCVGIKEEPLGDWLCPHCRNHSPSKIKIAR
jgi:hypothetical protein